MLQILRTPFSAPGSQMFEKDVRCAIEPNDKGLDKFGGRDGGFPLANLIAGRFDIPCPAKLGKAPHPTSKGEQSVPEEDATLDKMRETVENVVSTL